MKLEEVDINTIKPYKNNPREIPMESVQKVMSSIREFGNNQPIVVDSDNIIVVGHTRWKALKQLGKKTAFIIKKDFKKMMPWLIVLWIIGQEKNLNGKTSY